MANYEVTHLEDNTTHSRPPILVNPLADNDNDWHQSQPDPAVEAFHKTLPSYRETKLIPLPSIASELNLKHVFLKDESTRFGLPSFKILGASWAIHRTLCQHLSLPPSAPITDLRDAIVAHNATRADNNEPPLSLITTTDGNWGRACARTCTLYSLPLTLHVPFFMPLATQDLIRAESPLITVHVLPKEKGSYDDCLSLVRSETVRTGALMVLDTSWPGYTQIPSWVTEGYETMLAETDRQVLAATGGLAPNVLFASVGVGSWAHSVVAHYKATNSNNKIMAVEPDTAAAFKGSLHCGDITPIITGESIMCGMNCGTTSHIAWPVLRDGVHAAVTVTDREAHGDVGWLREQGVDAGPCGAANLAALRKVCEAGVEGFGKGERAGMCVVLFSTEGGREYEVPE